MEQRGVEGAIEVIDLHAHYPIASPTHVVLLVGGESISFSVLRPGSAHFTSQPVLAIQNALFSRALMDVYLGRQPLLPDAKSIWADSAAKLLRAS